MLNDYQLAQGMRRLVYSGKAHPPTLPEFMKLCRTVGHADDIPDAKQLPRHPALERDPDPSMDPWGLLANRRLTQYVSTVIPAKPERYGRPASWEGMKASTEPNADASPEFVRNIGVLVAFKNRWADLMRESATADGVPIADQEASWNECMRMAEQQMAQKRAA